MQEEQRHTLRKPLRTRAVVTVDGQAPQQARTIDLSCEGIAVCVPEPVRSGQAGTIQFELFVNGTSKRIAARAKARYCILSGTEFRIGFEFVNVEPGSLLAIGQYLR